MIYTIIVITSHLVDCCQYSPSPYLPIYWYRLGLVQEEVLMISHRFF